MNSSSPTKIKEMFRSIAPAYDLLNHGLSFGVDLWWRRQASQKVSRCSPGLTGLDVAAGTGDLSASLQARGLKPMGADFVFEMVKQASKKFQSLPFLCADALSLPFSNCSFDFLSISFGLRNIPERQCALKEFKRVLRTGGFLLILEFSWKQSPWFRVPFRFYFHNILPLIGKLVSKNSYAYTYLPDSVDRFPEPSDLKKELEEMGFKRTGHQVLTFGIAHLHWGYV